jgi:hypothetical protein
MAKVVSPLPWAVLALVAAALVVVVGRRRTAAVAAAAVTAAALAALVVGWGEYAAAPAGSGANPLLVGVPLAGLVAAVAGLARRGRTVGPTLTLAAAAAVIGWALLRLEVLWTPVLPTDLPDALDRAGTALALGLSVAGAGLVVWSGGLAIGRPTADATAATDDPDPGADTAATA